MGGGSDYKTQCGNIIQLVYKIPANLVDNLSCEEEKCNTIKTYMSNMGIPTGMDCFGGDEVTCKFKGTREENVVGDGCFDPGLDTGCPTTTTSTTTTEIDIT